MFNILLKVMKIVYFEEIVKLNCKATWGVSEGSKMPNLYFGVLKRVKNGLKMAKKRIEILYFS